MTDEPAISVLDDRRCELGEGPIWHPERGQAFWFDILGRRLLTIENGIPRDWQFGEYVSAAGWIDRDRMLVASQRALTVFDVADGSSGQAWALEADNDMNRSNDGRAYPMGGFWIGTMAIQKPRGQRGAIYRFYRGEIRRLYGGIGVSNAICFAPDGRTAYWADTDSATIMRQRLGAEGWPEGAAEICVDLRAEKLRPDGAVVDAEGHIWNAQFGAGRVACYAPDGRLRRVVDLPASKTTCPAFIGSGLERMMVTTAGEGLEGAGDGLTYLVDGLGVRGQAEYRVRLD
ncbi:MAG: SMP-30/gluconolactonase/LRE family protein [Paracoccus sp. (in: a-proteobacteria)]